MLGTIVNSAAIILGGIMGLILKDRFSKPLQEIVTQGSGLAVVLLGLNTAIAAMQSPNASSMLYVISLVAGGIIGQLIDIEEKLERLGSLLEKRLGSGENTIAKSFVNGSLLYCVGSMAILGSFESGLTGNHTTLFIKSIIDGVMSIVFAASMGIGVIFSSASVFLYQGTLTLLSGLLSQLITDKMLCEISITGGILIAAIGINMLEIKKIKVGNLLPAVFIPVVYYLIYDLITKGA